MENSLEIESASQNLHYNRMKSTFPVIHKIPDVQIVKKKSIKKKVVSSVPLTNYDSDLNNHKKFSSKKRNTNNSGTRMKNGFRSSLNNELYNNVNITPLTNLNDFKDSFIRVIGRFRPNTSFENVKSLNIIKGNDRKEYGK